MNSFKKWIKCSILSVSLAAFLSICFIKPSYAYSSGELTNLILMLILNRTQGILNQINTLPVYIQDITQMAQNLNSTNDQGIIGNSQVNFASLAYSDYANQGEQMILSNQLTNQFLLNGGNLPQNAYELGYSILVAGQPLVSPLPKPTTAIPNPRALAQQHYLSYIAGTNVLFKQADPGWSDDAKNQYTNVYNTVSAISSYNAFMLSSLSTDQTTDPIRLGLINQATNTPWFTAIATEALGSVLRHLLMYTSQIFVELDQVLKNQQKQLTAQAMTNTLLILYANASVAQSMANMAAMQVKQQGVK